MEVIIVLFHKFLIQIIKIIFINDQHSNKNIGSNKYAHHYICGLCQKIVKQKNIGFEAQAMESDNHG